MFTSWTKSLKTLLSWRRQRYGHLLFGPVALTLVVASLVGGELPSWWVIGVRGVAAWFMVLALRLWDDLEDRERDAQQHPERVLTQVDSVRPYMLVVALLLSVVGLMTWLAGGALLPLVLLVGALLIFYRMKGQTWPGGGFVILLKYPVLVLVLGGTMQPVGLVAMAVVLMGVGLDEVFQGRPHPNKNKLTRGALLAVTLVTLLLFNNPKIAEVINAFN